MGNEAVNSGSREKGLFLSADPNGSDLDRLTPFKIRRVLLVASLYDCFVLEEDGRLKELLARSYHQWNLDYVPQLTRIVGGQNALELMKTEKFDLVVSMMRLKDMDPFTFGSEIKKKDPDLAVVVLAYNTPELQRFLAADDGKSVDRVFIWQGDARILLGIIQYMEDRKNAPSDTSLVGVQNILLIENSIAFYSAYLPFLFDTLKEVVLLSLKEDLTDAQKSLRLRARPKIHLAVSNEEARGVYDQYKGNLLGIVADVEPARDSDLMGGNGPAFIRSVLGEYPHLPILIQSRSKEAEQFAIRHGLGLLSKDSPTLMNEFKQHLIQSFGFGALVFGGQENSAVRVTNLDQLYSVIADLPEKALRESLQRGEIDRWLRVRTEFELSDRIEQIRKDPSWADVGVGAGIKKAMWEMRKNNHRGAIVPYSRYFHDDYSQFSLIGSGSIGGKARGLAFLDRVLLLCFDPSSFPGVTVSIPRTVVIGTDVFDEFIRENGLLEFAVKDHTDSHIINAFIKASLPPKILGDLRDFVTHVRVPLAVRSSSLLEDSLYQPFAGIYATKMLPNDQFDDGARFLNLVNAIKFVYASTFFREAKSYIQNTPHRVEDEKMAVIIQTVVGRHHRNRFYPDFSGVGRSYNFYPAGGAKPEDGVANVAVGLGKTVVDGGVSLHFSPEYPAVLPQFASVKDMLNYSQREFYAVAMNHVASVAFLEEDQYLVRLGLDAAEKDGVLQYLASTYSPVNDLVYDGITQEGPRIVSFAHILKNEIFPLAKLLSMLLSLGQEAMGNPVEIEFAATFADSSIFPSQFSVLQIRPLVVHDELVHVDLDEMNRESALCFSTQVLGNGRIVNIHDIVLVKRDGFDMSQTPGIAQEIGKINMRLREENRPYLLIGPGRWGSSDPWLGIPVKWNQISNAKVIVEAHLPGIFIDPSQGSHFFQNLTSLRIGYFTVPSNADLGFVDWPWLEAAKAENQSRHVKQVRLNRPLLVQMDGRRGMGMVFKPGEADV